MTTRWDAQAWRALLCLAAAVLLAAEAAAHVVVPERFHPAVESYRRAMFLLNLDPVPWQAVRADSDRLASALGAVSEARAGAFREAVARAVAAVTAAAKPEGEGPGPAPREAARAVFELATRAVADLISAELRELKRAAAAGEREAAAKHVARARRYWAGFEHEVKASDKPMFREIGRRWLAISTALGSAPLLGRGERAMDAAAVAAAVEAIEAYMTASYGAFEAPAGRPLAPLPHASPTFDARAAIPAKLPPGSNVNKARPRPRQVLNLVARGADETGAPLVAFGDMAFASPLILGEPARSLGIGCATCHNKGVTNPGFEIPGLSLRPGGIDVTNAYFAPHGNNGLLDPLDIPDLRGIRFTAPYGRNGRFASLADFVRNVIVNEFNGPEPDPIVVDGILAYMLEFDFLPNPKLEKDGRLDDRAGPAARRGEALFNRPFARMGGMSCATCHLPSGNFVDHRRHDIGSLGGAGEGSLDRALDTPTLLGARFTAPYFHDGSLASLRDVVLWFDSSYGLGLAAAEVADLTAYLEAVGDGEAPYEEDPDAAAPAEIEEQYIFIASWEFLRAKAKPGLADILFRSVAQELRNEKWALRYPEATEVVERMARIAEDAAAANRDGRTEAVDAGVAAFRRLYLRNKALIDGRSAPSLAGR